MTRFAVLLTVAALCCATDEPRMNQVQVLGSHNSYKLAIDEPLRTLLRESMGARLESLEYSHIPMPEQLDLGLRSLEIDVVHDPEGGRFAAPLGLKMVRDNGLAAGAAYDPEGRMKLPGLKVLHVPDIDFRSSVFTFREALDVLKRWSDAHPRHLPVIVTMNAKDSPVDRPGYVKPLPFDAAAFDAWDAEIRAGLPAAKLIVPDDVRGSHPTLEEAVLAGGWPKLDAARGRFLFVLDETGAKLESYAKGHGSLRGRAMFVNAAQGRPEAAFLIVNDPVRSQARIQGLVRKGYMVRTRADADTVEARKGDYSRWKAALASGAQVISTDYYRAEPALGTGYEVRLKGQWNPLIGPAGSAVQPE